MAVRLVIHVADRSVAVEGTGCAEPRPLPNSSVRMAPDQLASAIVAAVEAVARPPQTATLVLSASWCYIHRFAVAQHRPTHAVLAYALEEYLPVEIEQLTCDFLRTAGGDYIGVAVET